VRYQGETLVRVTVRSLPSGGLCCTRPLEKLAPPQYRAFCSQESIHGSAIITKLLIAHNDMSNDNQSPEGKTKKYHFRFCDRVDFCSRSRYTRYHDVV